MQRIEMITHKDVKKFLQHFLDTSVNYLKQNGVVFTPEQKAKIKALKDNIKGLIDTGISYGGHLESKAAYDGTLKQIRRFLEAPNDHQKTKVAMLGQIASRTLDKLNPKFIEIFNNEAERFLPESTTSKLKSIFYKKDKPDSLAESIPVKLCIYSSADPRDRSKNFLQIYKDDLQNSTHNETNMKYVETIKPFKVPIHTMQRNYDDNGILSMGSKNKFNDDVYNIFCLDTGANNSVNERIILDNKFDHASSTCLLLAKPYVDPYDVIRSNIYLLKNSRMRYFVVDPGNQDQVCAAIKKCVILAASNQRPDLIPASQFENLFDKVDQYFINRSKAYDANNKNTSVVKILKKVGLTRDVGGIINQYLSPEDVARLKLAEVAKDDVKPGGPMKKP